jgi:tetratricopeptide (TPR) repeat protein
LLRAVSFINRKQFAAAEQDVRKAIAIAPESPAGYIQLGNLHLAQQQYSDAAKAFQQGLDRDPHSQDSLSGLMNSYLAQTEVDKAIAAANVQIAKVPDSSSFYDLLGTVLFSTKKDLPGAEAAFTKSAELDKDNSDAVLKLGQVQVARGATDRAIATYQSALQKNPKQVSFYILLGEIYESQRLWEQAKQMYQKALELKPDNAMASNNLAYVLLQTGGDIDTALSLAQAARRGAPESPNAADTLGWVYYQKGEYKSAIDLFQEAMQLNRKMKRPDDPTFHYHLGLAYAKADQPDLAKHELRLVLKIDPNFGDAQEVRTQLAAL